MMFRSSHQNKIYSFKRETSFGIRKWTIGVVSVSLGTAIVTAAPTVLADSLETPMLATTETVEAAVTTVGTRSLNTAIAELKIAVEGLSDTAMINQAQALIVEAEVAVLVSTTSDEQISALTARVNELIENIQAVKVALIPTISSTDIVTSTELTNTITAKYTPAIDMTEVKGQTLANAIIAISLPNGYVVDIQADENGVYSLTLPGVKNKSALNIIVTAGDQMITDTVTVGLNSAMSRPKNEGQQLTSDTNLKSVVSAADRLNPPAITLVDRSDYLYFFEVAAVRNAIKAANPSANLSNANIVVADNGQATVTVPSDQSVRIFTPAETIKLRETSARPVINPVYEGDKIITGTGVEGAEIKLQITYATEIGSGDSLMAKPWISATQTATVINGRWEINWEVTGIKLYTDYIVHVSQTEPGKKQAGAATAVLPKGGGLNAPAITFVENTSSLTETEKTAVRNAIKAANPTANLADNQIAVAYNGYTVISLSDGSYYRFNPEETVAKHGSTILPLPKANPELISVGGTYDLTDNLSNSSQLPAGIRVTDVTPSGTINVNLPGNYTGTVRVSYPDGSYEDVVVPVTVVEQVVSAQPSINSIKSHDRTITGTGVNGATVTVTLPTGTQTATVSNGTWTINLPTPLAKDTRVTATQTEPNKKVSAVATQTVVPTAADKLAVPTTTPVNSTSALTEAEKTAVRNAIKAANPSANLTDANIVVANNGQATVTVPSDNSVRVFTPAQTVVARATSATPVINQVFVGDTTITGTGIDGSTVIIRNLPNTSLGNGPLNGSVWPVYTAIVSNGRWSVTLYEPLKYYDLIEAKQEEQNRLTSATVILVPAVKWNVPAITLVENTSSLTEAEKTAVRNAIKAANPTSGLSDANIVVANNGQATVTAPSDNSVHVFTPAQTVVASGDEASRHVVTLLPQTIKAGQTLTPADMIANRNELPESVNYTWIGTPPDFSVSGSIQYPRIRVTFADGSYKEVRIRLKIDYTQAQLYTPVGFIPTNLSVGTLIGPGDLIDNRNTLPNGTRFEWGTQPNLMTPGGKVARVRVIYPDGSIEEVVIRFTLR